MDSNIDLYTDGFKVQGVDPTNAQDYVTKAYGDTYYSGGGASDRIINGTNANSYLRADTTKLTANIQLDMGNNKIIGIASGVANDECPNMAQLNAYIPSRVSSNKLINSGNQVVCDSS